MERADLISNCDPIPKYLILYIILFTLIAIFGILGNTTVRKNFEQTCLKVIWKIQFQIGNFHVCTG